MIFTVEMVTFGMIHIPSLMQIGTGIQKLLAAGYTYRHTNSTIIS
jgi:hypothetical protein